MDIECLILYISNTPSHVGRPGSSQAHSRNGFKRADNLFNSCILIILARSRL